MEHKHQERNKYGERDYPSRPAERVVDVSPETQLFNTDVLDRTEYAYRQGQRGRPAGRRRLYKRYQTRQVHAKDVYEQRADEGNVIPAVIANDAADKIVYPAREYLEEVL